MRFKKKTNLGQKREFLEVKHRFNFGGFFYYMLLRTPLRATLFKKKKLFRHFVWANVQFHWTKWVQTTSSISP